MFIYIISYIYIYIDGNLQVSFFLVMLKIWVINDLPTANKCQHYMRFIFEPELYDTIAHILVIFDKRTKAVLVLSYHPRALLNFVIFFLLNTKKEN